MICRIAVVGRQVQRPPLRATFAADKRARTGPNLIRQAEAGKVLSLVADISCGKQNAVNGSLQGSTTGSAQPDNRCRCQRSEPVLQACESAAAWESPIPRIEAWVISTDDCARSGSVSSAIPGLCRSGRPPAGQVLRDVDLFAVWPMIARIAVQDDPVGVFGQEFPLGRGR